MKKMIAIILSLVLALGIFTVVTFAEAHTGVNFTKSYSDNYVNNVYNASYSLYSSSCVLKTTASSASGVWVRVMAYGTGIDGINYKDDQEYTNVAGTVVASVTIPVKYVQYSRHVGTRNLISTSTILDNCYVTYQ